MTQSDKELIEALEQPVRMGGTTSEDAYEVYDDLRLAAAARLRALTAEPVAFDCSGLYSEHTPITVGCSTATAEPAGEPHAWEAYWPGAGSISSITRVTRLKGQMLQWEKDGAEITPLYAAAPATAETDEVTDAMADAALKRSAEKDLNTLTNTQAMKRIIEAALSASPRREGWRPIETAPHNRNVLLGWRDWRDGTWCMEVGAASWGTRTGAISNMSGHGSATHWMPLPAAPQEDGK